MRGVADNSLLHLFLLLILRMRKNLPTVVFYFNIILICINKCTSYYILCMMYTDIAEHAKYLQNIPNCSKLHINASKEERLLISKILHNFAYSKKY